MPRSRREDLIRAAMRVFERNGYHASGLDMVLAEAGVSRMTLYNHFGSKDDLIEAALRRRDEEFRARLVEHVESVGGGGGDRILAVFEAWARWIGSDGFKGCPFHNAAAEYFDEGSGIRRAVAEHKAEVERYLVGGGAQAGFARASEVASRLNLILQGAVAQARVVGSDGLGIDARERVIASAREMVVLELDRAA